MSGLNEKDLIALLRELHFKPVPRERDCWIGCWDDVLVEVFPRPRKGLVRVMVWLRALSPDEPHVLWDETDDVGGTWLRDVVADAREADARRQNKPATRKTLSPDNGGVG